jgi:hypothetical protein
MFTPTFKIEDTLALKFEDAIAMQSNARWGKRRLNRRKVVGGRIYQLHATRGWKCIGRKAK